MKKDNICMAILAGGRGERFWPRSRKKKPKQLLSFLSDKTLLEDSMLRIRNIVNKKNLYVLCNKELKKSMAGLGVLKGINVIAEPVGRNTAGAVALICCLVEKKNPNSIIVILPCDQYIGHKQRFISSLKRAVKAASMSNKIVTIGIKPTYPATGYGYINVDRSRRECCPATFRVKNFKEKPDKYLAARYVKSKEFLWNSGIFVFRSSKMMSLFKKHSKRMFDLVSAIVNSGQFHKKLNILYPKIENISIDYCLMEKTKDILCVEGDFDWCDIGSWESFECIFSKDKNANVIKGNFAGLSVKDSMVFGERSHLIGAIGISKLIVIQTKDATLICHKDRAQDVRELVALLKGSKKTRKFI